MSTELIRITEIFYSLQGESTSIGLPTVFIRLTGCPLRCQYCDTAYAFSGGQRRTIAAILTELIDYNCSHVCVTGGEPLAQRPCITLLQELCNAGYQVSLETSGACDISLVDPRVMIVMDIKTPDSQECDKNLFKNLEYLKPTDQIKFVLCSRSDYEWACQIIHDYDLSKRIQLLFSPSWNQLDPTKLANWIVDDRLSVRFQLQLHKVLWNETRGC
ncbi:MAG: 7-carboxy-7-deazaguanine synthase QueE [Legionellales bacterium RIFCSPHIGHO2_12_FULL_42_9]|nr:MAG: 7-carboxy-7-deazaguanine synthase QueE [Legionellales bacterium RIFCSPHIGHO2_12_FULL_42_9]